MNTFVSVSSILQSTVYLSILIYTEVYGTMLVREQLGGMLYLVIISLMAHALNIYINSCGCDIINPSFQWEQVGL